MSVAICASSALESIVLPACLVFFHQRCLQFVGNSHRNQFSGCCRETDRCNRTDLLFPFGFLMAFVLLMIPVTKAEFRLSDTSIQNDLGLTKTHFVITNEYECHIAESVCYACQRGRGQLRKEPGRMSLSLLILVIDLKWVVQVITTMCSPSSFQLETGSRI